MHKKKFRRFAAKLHTLKDGALECIRSYPAARRENSNRLVDLITIVCALGVSAVTLIFALV
ncbi:MAG: hypothetical protein NC299_04180 [Lachnospiraceae bacterium]|nr:hypothetical protein [Ruminococcus sp.]MCM1274545.1 hypothetical protein [Lachnospiraceae bacterium]